MTERLTLKARPEMQAALARRAAPASAAPAPPAPPRPAALVPKPPAATTKTDKAAGQRRTRITEKSVQRHEMNVRITAMLAARWPEAFSKPRPLVVGIYRQIRGAIDNTELRSRDLSAFLAAWTHRKPYRAALEAGVRGINLDGTDAGPAFDDAKKTDPIGGTTG